MFWTFGLQIKGSGRKLANWYLRIFETCFDVSREKDTFDEKYSIANTAEDKICNLKHSLKTFSELKTYIFQLVRLVKLVLFKMNMDQNKIIVSG